MIVIIAFAILGLILGFALDEIFLLNKKVKSLEEKLDNIIASNSNDSED